MPNIRTICVAFLGLACIPPVVAGCSDADNRVPTKTEVKSADIKRQSYIDGLNIPPEQKAIMKSHMGGPAVSTAMDAAKPQAGKGGSARQ